ncbi:mCG144574, partial [Mus musculus]
VVINTNIPNIWGHASLCVCSFLEQLRFGNSNSSTKVQHVGEHRQVLRLGSQTPLLSQELCLPISVKRQLVFCPRGCFAWICCSALKIGSEQQIAIKEKPFVCWCFFFSFFSFFFFLFFSEVNVGGKEKGWLFHFL